MANIVTTNLQLYLNSKQGVSGTTWQDLSSNGRNATINGNVAVGANGMNFPGGASDNVKLQIPPDLYANQAHSFTFEFYTIANNFNNSALFDGDAGNYFLGTNYQAARPYLVSGSSGGANGNGSLATGTGTFITIVYDTSAHSIDFYVNGSLATHNDVTGNTYNFCQDSTDLLGGPNGSTYNGVLDCVRLYDRALSASEISQNYSVGTAVGLSSGNAYTAAVNDTVSAPSDSLTKSTSSHLSNSMSAPSDAVSTLSAHHYTATITDSLSAPSDTLGRAVASTKSDSMSTPSDALGKAVQASRSESVSSSDTLAKSLSHALSDTVSAPSDNVSTHVSKLYTATVNDTVSAPTDALGGRRVATVHIDTMSASDAIGKSIGSHANDTFSVSDALSESSGRSLQFNDSVTIVDSVYTGQGTSITPVNITLTVNTSLSDTRTVTTSLNDTRKVV